MDDKDLVIRSDAIMRGRQAEDILAESFGEAGWRVRRQPNMVVRRSGASYMIEVKAAPEGRSDRLIPLWSQAYLQAVRAAGDAHPPLVVVAAPRIAPRAAEQVLKFAAEYAPDAAAGVIDFVGLRLFRGPYLDSLNSADVHVAPRFLSRGKRADLFSDLNQWMLKVLLAPEIPEGLLSAPRGRYQNASQLARAAKVSVMSAFRLVELLQREGYLAESAPYLSLVRREDLFRRWQSSAARVVREVPMRFRLPGDSRKEIKRVLSNGSACLALFAAADALHFGFVHGVPPHVYVPRLRPASFSEWKNLVAAEPGEVPDLIIRQAPAPHSVFRGMVSVDGDLVSDIIQVWLDVSSSPSRGQEQASLIRRKVLDRVIRGVAADG